MGAGRRRCIGVGAVRLSMNALRLRSSTATSARSMRQGGVVSAVVLVAPVLALAFAPLRASATPMPRASATTTSTAASPAGSARPAASQKSAPSFAPDPPVTEAREHWRYTINVRDGELFVPSPTKIDHGKPVPATRSIGRFAIELYVGETLLERVRFDVPMLRDEPEPASKATRFDRKANGKLYVEIPNVERAAFAVLVDRATGSKRRVPWPPVDGIPKVTIPVATVHHGDGYPRGLCAPEPVP